MIPIFADGAGLPDPGILHVLTSWTFQPTVALPLVVVGWMYLAGMRRVNRRYPASPWPRRRALWFMAGLGVLFLVLESPIDIYAEVFLWIHMIQHVALMAIVPPCLLLGAPITLALRAATPAVRRRWLIPVLHSSVVKALSFPVVSWGLFAAAIVATHFSPLYEEALVNPWAHDAEHLIYLFTGLLFWWPVVGVDPGPWRMPYPVRLLYVFMAAPVNTFTALAIYGATSVLYPHYATIPRAWGPSPLTDQQWGGAVMWITGDLVLLGCVVALSFAWANHDRLEAIRIDERLDRERDAAERAGTMGPGGA